MKKKNNALTDALLEATKKTEEVKPLEPKPEKHNFSKIALSAFKDSRGNYHLVKIQYDPKTLATGEVTTEVLDSRALLVERFKINAVNLGILNPEQQGN